MDFKTTMEILAKRDLTIEEAKDFAVAQWSSVFKFVRAEEKARIKELEHENQQLKETIDLKDIGIREQKVIINGLEDKVKHLREVIKTADRIINSM